MARTESKMLSLGTKAPHFSLLDTEEKIVALSEFKNKKGLLVMFICNHCPFVKHVAPELSKLAATYIEKGVGVVAINSNDVINYPEDRPEMMKKEKEERGYPFPYLFDESQNVARAYLAACTPDFYLFDRDQKLIYRGQLDDSRPGNSIPVTGADLRGALEAMLSQKPISEKQKPSIGCGIKWKTLS